MLMVAGLLLGVAASAGQSGLTLEISSAQRDVLVGEPVKLVLKCRATTEVDGIVMDGDEIPVQFLRVIVDDGTQVRTYVEYPLEINERVFASGMLRPGDERLMNVVLFNGGYVDVSTARPQRSLLFPVPGQFSVRLAYGERGTAMSNPLQFSVKAPTGEDLEILEAIRREPKILVASGDAAAQLRSKELIEKHPTSRYLQLARMRALEIRAASPSRELDSATRRHLQGYDKAGLRRFVRDQHRQIAEEILSGRDWGVFEEEALALAVSSAQAAGEREKGETARRELFEKHPRSATVRRMKDKEAVVQNP